MITPLIAAYFLRSHGEQPHASGSAMNKYLGLLDWSLNTSKAHDYAARHPGRWGKLKSLRFDHRMVMVLAGFGALILTGVMIATLPMTFQPPINVDTSTVQVNLPPGSTLTQTEAVIDRVANMVRQDPSVESAFERINVGSGSVELKLKEDRKVTSTEFERNFSPKFASIPDARVNFQSQNGGGPGGAARDIMLYLGGDDPIKLAAAANAIAADMQKLPELRAPRSAADLATPEIVIKPRFDLAADLGVTTAALSQTIRIATLGDIEQNSAKFSLSDRQVPIQVSLAESQRKDISTLENLPVPTADGKSVPLRSVAEISFGAGPVSIQRTAQQRRIAVGADLAPGFVTGQAWKKIEALPSVKNLPEGVQRLNLGQTKWQAEMIRNFVIALFAGVLLVFAVLVLLYRRFLSPFVNMGSLWLCPLGAAIALHIAGQPLSLPVFIGILMLFGIVAKNSILLVDFAVEMMNHGMPKDEAIREAGHKRAQPIVMTTVAMVAGMLPIALSLSGDASWRAPMGVTVIGGLIFSTLLTLLLVPAYFSIAISLESRIGRLFHRVIGEEAHQVTRPVAAE
jgi:multidrug efflux pump subunit AcrB